MSPLSAQVCLPGAYRCACVELKLHNLAVCAIVNAHLLPDLGFDPAGGAAAAAEAAQVGGAQATAEAFRLLRSLVSNWLADATERSNPYADRLLTQLYRWLSSPASRFRDPMLLRLVRVVMRKLFRMLLAELHRFGAKVVYADFGSITLATGKRDPEQAAEFVENIRQVLLSRDLFSWLDVAPQREWHSLLFRDPFNYGGVVVGGGEQDLGEAEEEEAEDEGAAADGADGEDEEKEAEEGAEMRDGGAEEDEGAELGVDDEGSSPAHKKYSRSQSQSQRATPGSLLRPGAKTAAKAGGKAGAKVGGKGKKGGRSAIYDSSDEEEERPEIGGLDDGDRADAASEEGGSTGGAEGGEEGGESGDPDAAGAGAGPSQLTPRTPTQTGRSKAAGEIVSNWNVCEFLPEAIQQHFEARGPAEQMTRLSAVPVRLLHWCIFGPDAC